jgi:hypothetical protein
VVIGDDIYELQFKVEPEEMIDNPSLLEMDEDLDDMGDREGEGEERGQDFMQEDSNQLGGGSGSVGGQMERHLDAQDHQGEKHRTVAFQSANDFSKKVEEVMENVEASGEAGKQCSVVLGELLNGQEADVLHGEMESPNADARNALAAIPEAITPSCISKRRMSTADQSPLEQAERIKAACNLDSTPSKVTNRHLMPPFYNFRISK